MTEKKIFSDREIEKFRVRKGLVVKLNESKTYIAGELIELDQAQYKNHAHQVEREEQYQARQKQSSKGNSRIASSKTKPVEE